MNWLFSVSEAGIKANANSINLTETAKENGIDFYQYLVKLMTELPMYISINNLKFYITICLGQKIFELYVQNSQLSEIFSNSWPFSVRTVKGALYFIFRAY